MEQRFNHVLRTKDRKILNLPRKGSVKPLRFSFQVNLVSQNNQPTT
jgi:hypothetical protein